jgi:hypothetical protein
MVLFAGRLRIAAVCAGQLINIHDQQRFSLSRAQSLAASLDARSAESWAMPKTSRQQKITFGEMRESGVDRILIYCADYKCSHSIGMSADRWPDHVRLSDIEPLFVCKACGKRGADVRRHFAPARMGTGA